jgi:hypothetical protein
MNRVTSDCAFVRGKSSSFASPVGLKSSCFGRIKVEIEQPFPMIFNFIVVMSYSFMLIGISLVFVVPQIRANHREACVVGNDDEIKQLGSQGTIKTDSTQVVYLSQTNPF